MVHMCVQDSEFLLSVFVGAMGQDPGPRPDGSSRWTLINEPGLNTSGFRQRPKMPEIRNTALRQDVNSGDTCETVSQRMTCGTATPRSS